MRSEAAIVGRIAPNVVTNLIEFLVKNTIEM